MHEDDARECMRVQVIENQWGVPDSDRDDKRQVGRGGAKEEGHPFSTPDNIKYLGCILQITNSDFRQGKTKGRFAPFLLRILSWILFTNYKGWVAIAKLKPLSLFISLFHHCPMLL